MYDELYFYNTVFFEITINNKIEKSLKKESLFLSRWIAQKVKVVADKVLTSSGFLIIIARAARPSKL